MKKLMILLLLCGCATKDPVEAIIDQHQNHIGEVLEYAHNNMEQTKDVVFLENEIKSCNLALVDVKQAYYSRIAACNAKTDYWRLATFGMFLLLCGAVFVIIKRIFK
jgi:F0F1-type ATP synthase membrane subunit b/b'